MTPLELIGRLAVLAGALQRGEPWAIEEEAG